MKVKSPCIAVCDYDPIYKICVGCGRTTDEISLWTKMSEQEKNRVIKEAARRLLET